MKHPECVGFHSSGQLKTAVYQDDELVSSDTSNKSDGLYVYKKRDKGRLSKYVFYPQKDVVGYDIRYEQGKSVTELKALCEKLAQLHWV